jgi:probable F420-dependent oxidoreductase
MRVALAQGEPRPLRFGVLAVAPADPAGWRQQARSAEELGYSALLMPDHLDGQWGPLTSLAVAAEHTSRIALGTLMLAVGLRNPVVLAKELLTLAQFAPGRLEIGLGAGWFDADHTAAGLTLGPPGPRIQRAEEAMQILQGLWTDHKLTFKGRHFALADAIGEPRPPEPGQVKWVLGGGGRQLLAAAARHADVVPVSARMASGGKDSSFGSTATAAEFDRRIAWLRRCAGPRMAHIEVQCLVFACAVVADRDRYAARVLSPMFGLPPAQALASPLALAGPTEQICDQILAHRERFGISYWVVRGTQLRQFAPVVARLTGL